MGFKNCTISKTTQKYFVDNRLAYPNDETKRNSRKFVKALRPLRVRGTKVCEDLTAPTMKNLAHFAPRMFLSAQLTPICLIFCSPFLSQDYVVPASSAPECLAFAEDFADLLSRLFTYDPADRISAAEALEHNYFKYEVDEAGQVLSVNS